MFVFLIYYSFFASFTRETQSFFFILFIFKLYHVYDMIHERVEKKEHC